MVGGSATAYVQRLVKDGLDDEAIERRVLLHQNKLDWDFPVGNPFWFEGLKTNADRLRRLLYPYLHSIRTSPDEIGTSDVGVEPFSSSLDDNNSLFSSRSTDVSSRSRFLLSPSRLRAQAFEDVWASIHPMAQMLARRQIAADDHLSASDLGLLVQAAQVAAWKAMSSWKGIAAKFTTYAYSAMRNAMKDQSDELRALPACDMDDHPEADDLADSVCGVLDIFEAIRHTTDADLLVAQALGIPDKELEGANLRVRRHRAKSKLAASLSSTDDLSDVR